MAPQHTLLSRAGIPTTEAELHSTSEPQVGEWPGAVKVATWLGGALGVWAVLGWLIWASVR